jgi:hypothetical protein
MLIDMSRTLEQIEDEVLRLPEESRVRLMERLLSSFQEQAGSEEEGIARAEVAPVSWTPHDWGERSPRCRRDTELHTHLSSAGR